MSQDVQTLRADALVHALKNLKALHSQQGKVSHAKGVQSAIDLVQRTVQAGRARTPVQFLCKLQPSDAVSRPSEAPPRP